MIVTVTFDLSTLKGEKDYEVYMKGEGYRITATNYRLWLEHQLEGCKPEYKRHFHVCLEKLKHYAFENKVPLYKRLDNGIPRYNGDIEILEFLDKQGIKD